METITKPFITIGRFIRQTIDELRKVVTPTVREWVGWIVASSSSCSCSWHS